MNDGTFLQKQFEMEVHVKNNAFNICYTFAAILTVTLIAPAYADFSDATANALVQNCISYTQKLGKHPSQATKICQCQIENLKKVFDEDQAQFYLTASKFDLKAMKHQKEKHGQKWYDETMKIINNDSLMRDERCEK
jgi:urease accessory protein UreF